MVLNISLRRSFPVAILLAAALIPGTRALGAGRPGHSNTQSGANLAYTPLGETVFQCGTYKGNEVELKAREALHLRNKKQFEQNQTAGPALLDYVYNNVWVVEDDGSLTISGTNAFDTDAQTHQYVNNGGGVYTVSQVTYSYDPTVGTVLSPGDDGAVLVNLPFSFPFAGGSYTQMYVSGNGAVSFGAVMNPAGFYDSADFFSTTPKIAPYYLDLNETANGDVRVISDPTKYTVTWVNVYEYGSTKTNTFQLVLYPSGNFTITYGGITSTTALNGSPVITGFHPGGDPLLEEISLSSDLPYVSSAGAAVFEQYFSYPSPLIDEVALLQKFYSQFPDDFFQVVFFANFSPYMPGAFAYERNIKNDVTGIGLGIFDGSGAYGSSGALESLCNMGSVSHWTSSDPTARVYGKGNNYLTIQGQESGHRWGAFVNYDDGGGASNLILGRADAHWSYYFDVDHSSLEGGDWVNTGGINYTCPTNIDYFSELDEYLFGLRTPEEVKDMFFVSSASNDMTAARSVGTPVLGATCSGTYVPVTIEEIIAAEGPRTPAAADENHDVRQAFILLVAQGTTPTQQELDKIAGFRAAWEPYFEKSCDGRLTCNTSLTNTYDVAVIKGEVRDRYSQNLVPDFTAVSVERGFSQHVADGGQFAFRYADGPLLGSSEPATLIFSAPGYLPDTLQTTATYGTTDERVGLYYGIWLTPIATAAGEVPARTDLRANHPNPFNPTTTIEYTLADTRPIRLDIFDAAGRRVRVLFDGLQSKGEHHAVFDGRNDRGQPLASGVYFYRLQAGDIVQTRKMVLLK